MKQLTKEV